MATAQDAPLLRDSKSRVSNFWTHLDRLVATSEIVIDRPSGSRHPRHPGIIYPLDYGYLAGTSGGDGDGIDIWRGSGPDPRLDAVVCTVDLDKRDSDVKLLLGCTQAEQDTILRFHSDGAMAAVLIRREELRMPAEGSDPLTRTVQEAVDNQLRENNPPETKQTLDRLMAEGHSRDQAIALISKALAVEIREVMKTGLPYNEERYLLALGKLPELPD